LGSRVRVSGSGSGFRVKGLGFRVVRFRALGLGFRFGVEGLRFRI